MYRNDAFPCVVVYTVQCVHVQCTGTVLCLQEWLISLAVIHPATEEEQRISDMVFSLFR